MDTSHKFLVSFQLDLCCLSFQDSVFTPFLSVLLDVLFILRLSAKRIPPDDSEYFPFLIFRQLLDHRDQLLCILARLVQCVSSFPQLLTSFLCYNSLKGGVELNDNFDWKQFEDYLKSDEYVKSVKKYEQSEEFKNAMKKIKRNKWKRRISSIGKSFVSNIFNIISTIISIAALIVAILSYLK